MLLVVTDQGPLTRALCKEARRRGWDAHVAPPSDDDLFMKALGQDAVVYLAAPRMLAGILDPAPDVANVQAALAASNAPGVGVFVAVFPRGGAYADEMIAIRKFGKAYVMVELPLLLEELGEAMAGDGNGARDDDDSLWLPTAGRVAATRARVAARAVLDAVLTEQQGRVQAVKGTTLEAPVLFARAAETVGREIHVHTVPAALHRAVRPLARWIKGAEPKALALADRLLVLPPGEWLGPSANDRSSRTESSRNTNTAA